MKGKKYLAVFTATPRYIYRESRGELKGEMVEKPLTLQYQADTYEQGLDMAVKWTYDRFENVILDWYDMPRIGSLKVRVNTIGHGIEGTHSVPPLFEWKFDSGYTLEQRVKSWKDKHPATAKTDPQEEIDSYEQDDTDGRNAREEIERGLRGSGKGMHSAPHSG